MIESTYLISSVFTLGYRVSGDVTIGSTLQLVWPERQRGANMLCNRMVDKVLSSAEIDTPVCGGRVAWCHKLFRAELAFIVLHEEGLGAISNS